MSMTYNVRGEENSQDHQCYDPQLRCNPIARTVQTEIEIVLIEAFSV
jgi:hypothetical protein